MNNPTVGQSQLEIQDNLPEQQSLQAMQPGDSYPIGEPVVNATPVAPISRKAYTDPLGLIWEGKL